MGSAKPPRYLLTCHCCGQTHVSPDHVREIPDHLLMGKLPASEYPWIAVRWKDVVIFTNQEWSPFVLLPDGRVTTIDAHLPHAVRGDGGA